MSTFPFRTGDRALLTTRSKRDSRSGIVEITSVTEQDEFFYVSWRNLGPNWGATDLGRFGASRVYKDRVLPYGCTFSAVR
jgi:hypothetical protein